MKLSICCGGVYDELMLTGQNIQFVIVIDSKLSHIKFSQDFLPLSFIFDLVLQPDNTFRELLFCLIPLYLHKKRVFSCYYQNALILISEYCDLIVC